MASSREESPDWLRSFQVPNKSVVTLTSSSDSSSDGSSRKVQEIKTSNDLNHRTEEEEPDPDLVLVENGDESPYQKLPQSKVLKIKKDEEHHFPTEGDVDDFEVANDEILGKSTESRVASRLPLVISERVARSKALVECEGDAIDMSGDVGAVGRVVISSAPSGDPEMFLDLKGTIYRTTIVPSRTFCVVSFGQSEAKVEAVMNDFIQLKSVSNLYESETMIEGTLDGFAFDSEEEGEKNNKACNQKDQVGENKGSKTTKGSGNDANKMDGAQKKAKILRKQPAKGGRKSQAPKTKKSKK